jgi:OOP family OmpA-OmpF porin
MSRTVKVLIGLLATLLLGWAWHGPLGNGARLIDALEGQARAAVAEGELAGIDVRLGRDPLSRAATLSGPANDLQREGLGSGKGLSDYARDVEGIGTVRWADEPAAGSATMPLLAETLLLLLLGYAAGLGAARLLFGRPKRESYL